MLKNRINPMEQKLFYYTEYTECQAFCPVVRIGFPHATSHPQTSVAPSPGSKGETHSLAGEGGGGQFRRIDRHSGTLQYVYYNTSPVYYLQICTVLSVTVNSVSAKASLLYNKFKLFVFFKKKTVSSCRPPYFTPQIPRWVLTYGSDLQPPDS